MNSITKPATILNNQTSFPNDDPNITISDDNDDDVPVQKNQIKKCHGRWSKQEQLIFLKNFINCKDNLENLLKFLSSRDMAQVKIHTHQFIQMCKKEFSVSKTKQQNKVILYNICQNYGYHPSDSYLEQLEEVILNPAYNIIINKNEEELLSRKTTRITKEENRPANPKKRIQSKSPIFLVKKLPRKNANVINILTINVLTNHSPVINEKNTPNHNKNDQAKPFIPNPFNIEFDPHIMNTNLNKPSMNKGVDYYEDDIVNNLIQGHHEGNDLDSNMRDYESIN